MRKNYNPLEYKPHIEYVTKRGDKKCYQYPSEWEEAEFDDDGNIIYAKSFLGYHIEFKYFYSGSVCQIKRYQDGSRVETSINGKDWEVCVEHYTPQGFIEKAHYKTCHEDGKIAHIQYRPGDDWETWEYTKRGLLKRHETSFGNVEKWQYNKDGEVVHYSRSGVRTPEFEGLLHER